MSFFSFFFCTQNVHRRVHKISARDVFWARSIQSHTDILTPGSRGTVACTTTARTTEESRFESQNLSRPALGPTNPLNKQVTSHPIRTDRLHHHGVYKENQGKVYRQPAGRPNGLPTRSTQPTFCTNFLSPISALHAPFSTRKYFSAIEYGV